MAAPGLAPQGVHEAIAERFTSFFATMEVMRYHEDYGRHWHVPHTSWRHWPNAVPGEEYLVTQLRHWVQGLPQLERRYHHRFGRSTNMAQRHRCHVVQLSSNGRIALPQGFIRAIESLVIEPSDTPNLYWCAPAVEASWIACYIGNRDGLRPQLFPNTTLPNWRNFECSHRCIEHWQRSNPADADLHCICMQCLIWESKPNNQARGHSRCGRMCAHNCGQIVCVCQGVHQPPCF